MVTPVSVRPPGLTSAAASEGMLLALDRLVSGAKEDQHWFDLTEYDIYSRDPMSTWLGKFSLTPMVPVPLPYAMPYPYFINGPTGAWSESNANVSAISSLTNATLAAGAFNATSSLGSGGLHLRSVWTNQPMSMKDVLYLCKEAAKIIWTKSADDRVTERGTVIRVVRKERQVSLEIEILHPWRDAQEDIQWRDLAHALKLSLIPLIHCGCYGSMSHAILDDFGIAVAHVVYFRLQRPGLREDGAANGTTVEMT